MKEKGNDSESLRPFSDTGAQSRSNEFTGRVFAHPTTFAANVSERELPTCTSCTPHFLSSFQKSKRPAEQIKRVEIGRQAWKKRNAFQEKA